MIERKKKYSKSKHFESERIWWFLLKIIIFFAASRPSVQQSASGIDEDWKLEESEAKILPEKKRIGVELLALKSEMDFLMCF